MKEIQDADSRIDSLKGFDPFGQLEGVTKARRVHGRISKALTRDSAKLRKTLSVSVMQKHWLSWVYRENNLPYGRSERSVKHAPQRDRRGKSLGRRWRYRHGERQ